MTSISWIALSMKLLKRCPVHSFHIDSLQHLMIENIKQRLPSAVTSWSTENDMPPNFVPETPIATKPSVCGRRSLLKSSMRVEIANPKKTHCAPWFFFMMRSWWWCLLISKEGACRDDMAPDVTMYGTIYGCILGSDTLQLKQVSWRLRNKASRFGHRFSGVYCAPSQLRPLYFREERRRDGTFAETCTSQCPGHASCDRCNNNNNVALLNWSGTFETSDCPYLACQTEWIVCRLRSSPCAPTCSLYFFGADMDLTILHLHFFFENMFCRISQDASLSIHSVKKSCPMYCPTGPPENPQGHFHIHVTSIGVVQSLCIYGQPRPADIGKRNNNTINSKTKWTQAAAKSLRFIHFIWILSTPMALHPIQWQGCLHMDSQGSLWLLCFFGSPQEPIPRFRFDLTLVNNFKDWLIDWEE